MNAATSLSPHTACNGCPHVADEHSATGTCLALKGNSAMPCPCRGFGRNLPPDIATPLDGIPQCGIADDDDLIVTLPASVLIAALYIAREQIEEAHDDELSAYGVDIETDEQRDEFTNTLSRVLNDLEARA